MTEGPRDCLSCRIVIGETIPTGGLIAETSHFHAHQDVAYPIPGLVIVAAKRHFVALDEMTEEEVASLLPLLFAIRVAQRGALDIESTYYFYNEDTRHHFHVWMVPRYEWMGQFGRSIESVRPSLLHARATMSNADGEGAVQDAVNKLREWLSTNTAQSL